MISGGVIFYTDPDTALLTAVRENDLSTLRRLAFKPGGYGSNEIRKKVWPLLVGADTNVTLLDGNGNRLHCDYSSRIFQLQTQLFDGTEIKPKSCWM